MSTATRSIASPPAELRVLLVGCGKQMRENLVPCLAPNAGVRVVGYVDPSVDAARAARGDRDAAAAANLEDVDLAGVDAAVVATPPQACADAVDYLVGRGIRCFTEKPGGPNTAAIAASLHASASAGLVTQVGFNFRYADAIRHLREAADKERCGPLYTALTFRSRHPTQPQWGCPTTLEAWVRQNGCHAFELAAWIAGSPIARVTAKVVTRAAPDLFSGNLVLEHDDGSVTAARIGNDTPEFVLGATVELSGTDVLQLHHLGEVVAHRKSVRSTETVYWTKNLYGGWTRNGFGPQMDAFVRGDRGVPSLADALDASRVADAVLLSAGAGQAVPVVHEDCGVTR